MRFARVFCGLVAALTLTALAATPLAARPAQDTSSVSISSSESLPPHGQQITFTATVTGGGACTPALGESVVFSIDGTAAATVQLTATGSASYTTSDLSPGQHTVAAQYNGDAGCAPSSASMLQQVGSLGATLTTLIAAAATPTSGTAVLLTATVTGTATPCVLPSGSVTFIETTGGASLILGSAPLGVIYPGQALFAELGFAAGPHSVVASYPGDANCAASSSGAASVRALGTGAPLIGPGGLPTVLPATGLGIAILTGAGSSGTQVLRPGCSAVTLTSIAGSPVSAIASLVSPLGAVTGIWRFDPATQRYLAGFLAVSGAPLDITTTAGNAETFAVCVSTGGVIHSG